MVVRDLESKITLMGLILFFMYASHLFAHSSTITIVKMSMFKNIIYLDRFCKIFVFKSANRFSEQNLYKWVVLKFSWVNPFGLEWAD